MIRNSSSYRSGRRSARAGLTSGLILFLLLFAGCGAARIRHRVPIITVKPDYPAATWNPAAKTNYRSANRPHGLFSNDSITYVIIHTTDGSAAGAISRFKNPTSGVSAHYLVSRDGRVTQLVREKDIAWHAGNPTYNEHAIGIEHEAFSGQPGTLTDAMYRSSAALTRYLCLKYGIPMDRKHIIGHYEVPNPKIPGRFGGIDGHTDPGPYWNWDYYMHLVTHGDDGQPAG